MPTGAVPPALEMPGEGGVSPAEAASADFLPEQGDGVTTLGPAAAQVGFVRREQGRPRRARLALREGVRGGEPADRLVFFRLLAA